MKSLYEQIVEVYPELIENNSIFHSKIILQNDSDGIGDYIASWDYEQPIPDGLTLGKPTA